VTAVTKPDTLRATATSAPQEPARAGRAHPPSLGDPCGLNGSGPPFRGRHGPVPYIVSWSAEKCAGARVIQTVSGIGYADETLYDRDEQGVLWSRVLSRPGIGEPLYGKVHPLRQRRAMRRLLCQVCAGPADKNDLGTLWLLRDYREDWPNWPEGMGNAHPPLCIRCARISVKSCPWLRSNFVAVRANSTVAGVAGAVYLPSYPFPEFMTTTTVAYGARDYRWVQAGQLVRTLHECKITEL
jgi:hypothetical protein